VVAFRVPLRLAGVLFWTLCCLPAGLAALAAAPVSRTLRLRLGARATWLWSLGLLRVLGVRRRVEGPRPPRGALVVSNHLSYLDIMALGATYPSTFVAKHEIAGWPLLGPLTRLVGTLFIDRERLRDTVRLRQELDDLLRQGLTITLFAEGTSWRGDRLLPFRPPLLAPAAELQVPCVPAVITWRTPGAGPGAAGPDEGSPHLTVCWWGEMPFLPHFLGLLRLPRLEARIRFGPPVTGIQDRKRLAAVLQERAEAMFEPVPQ